MEGIQTVPETSTLKKRKFDDMSESETKVVSFFQSLIHKYGRYLTHCLALNHLKRSLKYAPKEIRDFFATSDEEFVEFFESRSLFFQVDAHKYLSVSMKPSRCYSTDMMKLFENEIKTYHQNSLSDLNISNIHLKVLEMSIKVLAHKNMKRFRLSVYVRNKREEVLSYFRVFSRSDADRFYDLHPMFFHSISNKSIALCNSEENSLQALTSNQMLEEICTRLEEETVKFFVGILFKEGRSSCFDLLCSLCMAPGFVIYHIAQNYCGSKFVRLFLNHKNIFCTEASIYVSLIENEETRRYRSLQTYPRVVSKKLQTYRIFFIEKCLSCLPTCDSIEQGIQYDTHHNSRANQSSLDLSISHNSRTQDLNFQSVPIKTETNINLFSVKSNQSDSDAMPHATRNESDTKRATIQTKVTIDGNFAPPTVTHFTDSHNDSLTLDTKLLYMFLSVDAVAKAKSETATFCQNFLFSHRKMFSGLPYNAFRRVLESAPIQVLQLCAFLSDDELLSFFTEQSHDFIVDEVGFVRLHDGFVIPSADDTSHSQQQQASNSVLEPRQQSMQQRTLYDKDALFGPGRSQLPLSGGSNFPVLHDDSKDCLCPDDIRHSNILDVGHVHEDENQFHSIAIEKCAVYHFQCFLKRHYRFLGEGVPLKALRETLWYAPANARRYFGKAHNQILLKFFKKHSDIFQVDAKSAVSLSNSSPNASFVGYHNMSKELNSKCKHFVLNFKTPKGSSSDFTGFLTVANRREFVRRSCGLVNRLSVGILQVSVKILMKSRTPVSYLKLKTFVENASKGKKIERYFTLLSLIDIGELYKLHSTLFRCDDNMVSLVDGVSVSMTTKHNTLSVIFDELERRAVEYYATILTKQGPTPWLQLAYDLVRAPGYLLYHFARNYTNFRFSRFFLNHSEVFHIDGSCSVNVLQDNKIGLQYFASLDDNHCSFSMKIERIIFIEKFVLCLAELDDIKRHGAMD